MSEKGDLLNITTAAGAIASPLWLPTLHDVSSAAAEVAPIVGLLFLCVRFVDYLLKRRDPA